MVIYLAFWMHKPVMILTKWVPILIIVTVCSPILYGQARILNRDFNDVTNDEGTIDRLEKALLEKTVRPMSKKVRDETNSLKDKELETMAESNMPFAVPPSDRRFFMSASALRGDSYQGQEPHSMGSAHYQFPQQPQHLIPVPGHPQYHYPYSYHHPSYPVQHAMQPPVANNPVHDYEAAWRNPPMYHSHPQIPSADADTVSYLRQSEQFANPSKYIVRPLGGDSVNALSDFYFVALVTGCTVAAVFAVVGFGMCYFRVSKNKRDASDAEYPAYGVTGPNKEVSPGAADRKLAQSAHMYHYQHQKQQMIAIEKSSGDDRHCSTSDVDSEEEGDEGHYTVYECPGLAPTGEMEVKNPLFTDDPTPASPVTNSEANTQQ